MSRESSQLQVLQQVTDPLIGLDDAVPEADHPQVLGDGQGGEEGLLPQIRGEGGALGARTGIREVSEYVNLPRQRAQ